MIGNGQVLGQEVYSFNVEKDSKFTKNYVQTRITSIRESEDNQAYYTFETVTKINNKKYVLGSGSSTEEVNHIIYLPKGAVISKFEL